MPDTNPLSDALRLSARRAQAAPAETRPAARDRGEGTRLVGAHFPAPVHRQLRQLAANEDRTMQSLLAEAFNDLFTKRRLPPIA